MKKLALFLVMIILICFSSSAYDYEIKDFGLPEGYRIFFADPENLIIHDGSNVKLYDINGNCLMDESYDHIYPYNYDFSVYRAYDTEYYYKNNAGSAPSYDNIFRIYYDDKLLEEARAFVEKQKGEIADEDNITIEIRHIYNSKGKLLYKEFDKAYSKEDFSKELENKKIIVLHDDSNKYAVMTVKGEYLSEYVYDEFTLSDVAPGIFELTNADETFIGNYNTGEWTRLDSIETTTYQYEVGIGFIEKTKEGKFAYYDNHLKKVTDIKFDEFLGVYNSSAVFKHEGKYYGFDTEWKLAYVGEKEIKAVYFDNYVIENEKGLLGLYDKNFNAVIPPEYKNIYWICDNVYIADNVLYNQGRIVASGIDFRDFENSFSEKGTCISAYKSNIKRNCILDVEGNELISSEELSFKTNGFDVFCDNGKGKIGRVIFKDTNPNIRINGKLLVSDTMAKIKNNITLVPLRALAEKTGFLVSYNADTKEIDITNGESKIKFTIGKTKAFANGKKISLEAAPEIINNRTLVPVRAISDAFGYDISWDGERRLVEISK